MGVLRGKALGCAGLSSLIWCNEGLQTPTHRWAPENAYIIFFLDECPERQPWGTVPLEQKFSCWANTPQRMQGRGRPTVAQPGAENLMHQGEGRGTWLSKSAGHLGKSTLRGHCPPRDRCGGFTRCGWALMRLPQKDPERGLLPKTGGGTSRDFWHESSKIKKRFLLKNEKLRARNDEGIGVLTPLRSTPYVHWRSCYCQRGLLYGGISSASLVCLFSINHKHTVWKLLPYLSFMAKGLERSGSTWMTTTAKVSAMEIQKGTPR